MEGEVRLLVIPAYHLHALWVITAKQENFIVPASLPAEYRVRIKIRVYTAKQFFAALRRFRPIVGTSL
jgi:hypothetical protein